MGRALEGEVAGVAGATRGAGRGIATALGEAGATVYQPEVAARWKKLGDVFYSYWGRMPYDMPG